jgi:CRP-like cAMP-binding protein
MLSPHKPAAIEDLLNGQRLLRRAFLEQPAHSIPRHRTIFAGNGGEAPVILMQRGIAYRSCTFPDGRRSIIDLLLPGDFGGLDHLVSAGGYQEVTAAANIVGYRAMRPAALRDMLGNPAVALRVTSLMAEVQWRMDRNMTAVLRLDAYERIALLLMDIYDRLRRRDLIARPTFNLPLTQKQIADHLGMTMIHVNRTLRRMREEKLAIVAQQVVMITDLDRLRALVSSMPRLSETLPAADASVTLGLNKEPTDERQVGYTGPPHYREQADRLRRLAATASDSGIYERLFRLARGFDNIAYDLEGAGR